MEHFYRNIQGWCIYTELYSEMVKKASDGAVFVEIGSWIGRSASFMGVEIANSGKKISFKCVDPWSDGGPDLGHRVKKMTVPLYEQFLKNTEPVKSFITSFRMPSVEAAKSFENKSLDFVMIDGSHVYEDVLADIKAWLPKMKPGSVLSGDDFNWPGVKQAVKELLPGYNSKVIPRLKPSFNSSGKLMSDPSYWVFQC